MYVYLTHPNTSGQIKLVSDVRSMNAIIDNLLYVTPKRNLLYVTDAHDGIPTHTFEHLSCFLPGLLALGVHTLDLNKRDKELHSWAAEGLAYTCWMTYADQATGLGPDEMRMTRWKAGDSHGKWLKHVKEWEKAGRPLGVPPGVREVAKEENEAWEYSLWKSTYLLRPEVRNSVSNYDGGWLMFRYIDSGELLSALENHRR